MVGIKRKLSLYQFDCFGGSSSSFSNTATFRLIHTFLKIKSPCFHNTAPEPWPWCQPWLHDQDRQRMAQRQCQSRHCNKGSKMVSQVLERLKTVEKDEDGGCKLTPQGQRDLGKITRRLAAAKKSIRTKGAGLINFLTHKKGRKKNKNKKKNNQILHVESST